MINMKELLEKNKVVAILRNVPVEKTLDYARAAYNGGVRLFEVALNSSNAYQEIELLHNSLPKDAVIGAGTAVNSGLAEHALLSGAQFLLTPSVNSSILRYCRIHDIPILPGVMTPSDVDLCLSYGFNTLKLFPASELPHTYIKSLKGPFDCTNYVAVGGVTMENLKQFFDDGFIGVGIGSNLIPKTYVAQGLWKKASDEIAEAVSLI